MFTKKYLFLYCSIIILIIRGAILGTIDKTFFSLFLFFIVIAIIFISNGGIKNGLEKFNNWFKTNTNILGISLLFILFFFPFSSVGVCKEADESIYAGNIIHHCIEYNESYKKSDTFIHYVSIILYIILALYFHKVLRAEDEKR